MIPWKTFRFRRKLQLVSLVKEEKLTTYEKVVAYLHALHVEAPTIEEYNRVTASSKTSGTAPVKKSVATKKSSTQKPKSDEDPTAVWESGLEGSYSEKKSTKAPAPSKQKAPAKKSTRTPRATKKKS